MYELREHSSLPSKNTRNNLSEFTAARKSSVSPASFITIPKLQKEYINLKILITSKNAFYRIPHFTKYKK